MMSNSMSTIKIATFHSDPYIAPCALQNFRPRHDCPHPGISAELLLLICNYLHITAELIPVDRDQIGNGEVNGTWYGVGGLVQNGTIDTTAVLWTETSFRRRYFHFSYPIMQFSPVFLTKSANPNLGVTAWLPFKVFSIPLWFCIILIAIIIHLSQVVLAVVYCKMRINSKKSSIRCVVVISGLTLILFTNLYKGRILTELLKEPKSQMFKDSWHMMELIEKDEISLINYGTNASWFPESIRSSRQFYFERLREVTKYNPIILELNFTKAVNIVAGGGFVLPIEDMAISSAKDINCNTDAVAGKELPTYRMSFIFMKNSPWLIKFNSALIVAQQSMENLVKKYTTVNKTKCKNKTEGDLDDGEPLTLFSLLGAFVALLIASLLATITLCLEGVISKCQKKAATFRMHSKYAKRKLSVVLARDYFKKLEKLIDQENELNSVFEIQRLIKHIEKITEEKMNSLKYKEMDENGQNWIVNILKIQEDALFASPINKAMM